MGGCAMQSLLNQGVLIRMPLGRSRFAKMGIHRINQTDGEPPSKKLQEKVIASLNMHVKSKLSATH
eukprot:4973123-Amphidinium_carterae.1